MKTTTTTCDNCGSKEIGGPDLSFEFPNWKKIHSQRCNIMYTIDTRLFENPVMGGKVPPKIDICFNCKKEAIIKLADILKNRK